MIYIGWPDEDKLSVIEQYIAENDIRHTVVISADQFPLHVEGADQVKFSDTIMYVTFYRLLQEVDNHTLIVLSECLRMQNRYDLHYNCIRNFLNQTNHCIVFQQLPQIDTAEDFMILFDFVTGSRWKRRGFDIDLVLDNAQVMVRPLPITFNRVEVPTPVTTRQKYEREKERLFNKLGARDPHTLPRNLYLIGGKDKLAHIDRQGGEQLSLFGNSGPRLYVARNQRLGRDNITSYGTAEQTAVPYTIVEFPHRFIEFSDFIGLTKQVQFDVLTTDLKVDDWYFNRYSDWKDRINETYSSLQQQ